MSTRSSNSPPMGAQSTFASGSLGSPVAMAFDGSGNLFVSDGSNTIFKFTPDGIKSTFAMGSLVIRLAFGGSGNLFASDPSGAIFKFTPAGIKSTFVSGLSFPFGLAFAPEIHQLLNISTRGFVGTGDAVLIGGFVVGGNGITGGHNAIVNEKVLIRAAGPSLTAFGVAGALQNPFLRLFDSHGASLLSLAPRRRMSHLLLAGYVAKGLRYAKLIDQEDDGQLPPTPATTWQTT